MIARVFAASLVGLAVISGVVTLLDSETANTIGDFLWPGWVVGILAAVSVFLLVLLDRAEHAEVASPKPDPTSHQERQAERLTADRRTFTKIREALSTNDVDFLRDHDFWAASPRARIDAARRFPDKYDRVDYEFHNAELEQARQALMGKAWAFGAAAGQHLSVMRGQPEFMSIGREDFVGEPEAYDRIMGDRQEALNTASAEFAQSYDAFVRVGRRVLAL